MTPIHKAACTLVTGLLPLAFSAQKGPAQQQPETQPPAPIVRVGPPKAVRPQPASPVQIAPDGTVVVHRPRPATQTPTPQTSTSRTPATQTQTPTTKTPTAQTPGNGTKTPPGTSAKPATPSTLTSKSAAATASPAGAPSRPAPEHKPTGPTFSATGLNRNILVLDPGHGGPDGGARIGETTLEKNVTLAFAFRLRSLLVARGFTVVMTRDSDAATQPNTPSAPLTLDDRAGIANHARAAACLLLHATGRGAGVHLYHSELAPAPAEVPLLPWLTAQAAWVPASQALEREMTASLSRSRVQLVSSTASVRPVDSLTCPALVLELAPETENPSSINDAGYQSHVAAAVAGALVNWVKVVQPPIKIPATPYVPHPKRRPEPTAESVPSAPTEVQP